MLLELFHFEFQIQGMTTGTFDLMLAGVCAKLSTNRQCFSAIANETSM